MEIYQLRAFIAVAKHGNFTRASEEIHLSQSTVSGQIKALEEDLGLLLFERKAGGVSLTNFGMELLPRAEKLLADIRGFTAYANDLQGRAAGKIRLGVPGDGKLLRLGELLSRIQNATPNIEIEVHNGMSGWVMNSVQKGDLDCGYFIGPNIHPDLLGTPLTTLKYRIAAPIAWADRIKSADWNEIADMPWITTPALGSPRQMAIEMFREHGVEPKKLTIADRGSTVIDLVVAGVGLALLEESTALAAVERKEIVLWENESRQVNLWFIHSAERQNDSIILAMTKMIREVWQ